MEEFINGEGELTATLMRLNSYFTPITNEKHFSLICSFYCSLLKES